MAPVEAVVAPIRRVGEPAGKDPAFPGANHDDAGFCLFHPRTRLATKKDDKAKTDDASAWRLHRKICPQCGTMKASECSRTMRRKASVELQKPPAASSKNKDAEKQKHNAKSEPPKRRVTRENDTLRSSKVVANEKEGNQQSGKANKAGGGAKHGQRKNMHENQPKNACGDESKRKGSSRADTEPEAGKHVQVNNAKNTSGHEASGAGKHRTTNHKNDSKDELKGKCVSRAADKGEDGQKASREMMLVEKKMEREPSSGVRHREPLKKKNSYGRKTEADDAVGKRLNKDKHIDQKESSKKGAHAAQTQNKPDRQPVMKNEDSDTRKKSDSRSKSPMHRPLRTRVPAQYHVRSAPASTLSTYRQAFLEEAAQMSCFAAPGLAASKVRVPSKIQLGGE